MSTDLAEAAAMDSEERPVEAAAAYERAIARGFGDIETFQDLWALYLSCLDMGLYSAHHLSDEFVNRCNRRYSALIDMAESRFGPSDIIAFWRHYHLWRTLGD